MASANVDLVRSIYADWERGNYLGSDEWAHPEIEVVIADGPEPGSWTGQTAMTEGFRGFVSPWEEYRTVAEEFRELDDERVLVLVSRSGRGKTSGLDLGQMRNKGAGVFHVRSGKVTRFVTWWDRERAFADLGLASDANSLRP